MTDETDLDNAISNIFANQIEAATLDDLGVDTAVEVQSAAKRNYVKFDENLILSDKGLPTIYRKFPRRIRLKGKGHELRDMEKLLQAYQMWAHGLYPRFRFADFLRSIERLGHKKSVRAYRESKLNDARRGRPLDESPSPELRPTNPHSTIEADDFNAWTRILGQSSVNDKLKDVREGDSDNDDNEKDAADKKHMLDSEENIVGADLDTQKPISNQVSTVDALTKDSSTGADNATTNEDTELIMEQLLDDAF
ncbi:hypothetical protein CANCADRAFT_31920 [Tortispora caseinolytica NRRL Y-17796]|uniref:Chromosome segregation in meiosis protein n=1 Tax=Tortispora caseinolytica NRRL Y-17796 TaxID=767744 RepID=A0A1E4THJ0_9ASCO|nr:hypothetical protein CANCADRAFT_31920 [Tortispora caseinolytica NRRL Y-17796]